MFSSLNSITKILTQKLQKIFPMHEYINQICKNVYNYSFSFNLHSRPFFNCKGRRDRERERKRETWTWERNVGWLLCCMCPNRGIKPTTWIRALTRNQTHDLLVYGSTLQPTEPYQPGQWGGGGSWVLEIRMYIIILISKSFSGPFFYWMNSGLNLTFKAPASLFNIILQSNGSTHCLRISYMLLPQTLVFSISSPCLEWASLLSTISHSSIWPT